MPKKKKRHIRADRVLTIMAACSFLLCILYGAFLFVDYKLSAFNLSNKNQAVSVADFETLGYTNEEALKLNSIKDIDLQRVVIQYPVNKINYELAIKDGMNIDKFKHGQKLVNKFPKAGSAEIIAMLEKRGEEEEGNPYQEDMYYIAANKERYENISQYFNEYNYNTHSDYIRDIVEYVNCDGDINFYENVKTTDTSKNELMLVNKRNTIPSDFVPKNLVEMDISYGQGLLDATAYEKLKALIDDCRSQNPNYRLFATSGYRSYDEEYVNYENDGPGYSEHQTGLAVDLVRTNGASVWNFENTYEMLWLMSNCNRYGFVMRYPENGAEDLVCNSYKPWHFRYVGTDVALFLQAKNLYFEEYYAFYLA